MKKLLCLGVTALFAMFGIVRAEGDVTFTFNPETGTKLAPDAKITVTTQLGEGQEINYKWCTKEEVDTAKWNQDWMAYADEQPTTKLEAGINNDTMYLRVAVVENVTSHDDGTWTADVKGYGQAKYIVDRALENKLVIVPNGEEIVKENDTVTVTVKFGDKGIEGTIVYKWYATMNEANADVNLEGAQTYVETAKPVITGEKPILSVGYKNAEGWIIKPVTIEYTFKFNFNPVTGTTVAPGTKITVTTEVGEGEELNYKWCTKEEADAAEWSQDWLKYEEEQPVAALDARTTKVKDTLYLKVALVKDVTADENGKWTATVGGYAQAMYIVDKALANKLEIVPNGEKIVKENDTVTVTVKFGGEEIEGTIVYKWYATMDEANADTTLLTTAEEYVATAKPVITKAKPVLTVGYKNVAGWVIEPKTIEYLFVDVAVENVELAGVNVYPNPNAGNFNVAVPERARIEIFGLNGAKVMSREVNAGVEAFQLNHSGIYFVRVMAGNKTAVKRVVVR